MSLDYKRINKAAWDNRTGTHVKSKFYDVEGFKAGQSSLNQLELSLLGEVSGKSLLHLQCHFGLDSLSLARLGAKVTGVDLSEAAIDQARSLNQTLNLDAEFVCADVYDFGRESNESFDLVYTSYGVLCWLPDLTEWAELIAKALKPGGEFHLVEFHPVADVFMGYPYFGDGEALVEQEGTYTENCDGTESTVVTWGHSLGEIITALVAAGLKLDFLHEFDASPYDCFTHAEQGADGLFRVKHKEQAIPLVFSLKATK